MRCGLFVLVCYGFLDAAVAAENYTHQADHAAATNINYPLAEGVVDASGVMIYYASVGRGPPLLIVHGGPGGSHDYFLPYLLPLARHHRLIFIDERGSGRSVQLEDPTGYTVDAMVEDVEAVRRGLALGKIGLMGHSFGGVLAQAYALKYQAHLSHLILASTFPSTAQMNRVFARMKEKMAPTLREKIESMEKAGLFGKGPDYRKNRYADDYMIAAWGEGYFPYVYQNHPPPNYDPLDDGKISWDLYREMWGSNGEFVIDGNLKSVEYVDRLSSIHTATLVIVGDHDECDPALSEEMHSKIPDSQLVILPKSGHMTFVDQPMLFNNAIDEFLHR
jgi:proline iminopeptidase